MQGITGSVFWLVVLGFLMYFTVIMPQKKQRNQRMLMLEKLEVGDKIVTIGGIYGKITAFEETTMQLEVAPNLHLKMQRAAVSFVEEDEENNQEKTAVVK